MSTPLRPRTLLAYGSGALGTAVTGTMFLFFFSYYLTDVARLSPLFVVALQVLRNLWSAGSDPLIGHFTDRVNTRWGRRKPFIAAGMIPFGFCFAFLWQAPTGLSPWVAAGLLGVAMVAYDTAASSVSVPYSAMTPAITADYDERTKLGGVRQAFSMLGGLLVGGVVQGGVELFATPQAGFGAMGWVFGVVGALSFLPVLWGVKERRGDERAPDAAPLFSMFKVTLKNRAFVAALFVYLLSWVSVGICSTMFIYFLTHWMKMESDVTTALLVVQVVALVSIPGHVWMSKRFGKRTAFIVGMSAWALVQAATFFLGPEHRAFALPLMGLAGIGVGAAHVLPFAMVPDCIELDELKTGQRREGAYYGVMSFAEKLGSSLALGGVGLVLSFYGYDGASPVQSAEATFALRLLMGPLPTVLLVGSIIAAVFYPVSKVRYAAVCEALEKKRAAAVRLVPLSQTA